MSDTQATPNQSRLEVDIREDPEKNLVRATLSGRLDIFTYRDLSKRLEEAAGGRSGIRLLVDLSKVNFVASSGWSVFIATRSRLKRGEGKMAFAGLNEDLTRVYEGMKMNELVPAYPTPAAALAALLEP